MRTQAAAPWHRLGLLLFCLLVSFCERNAPIDHGYAGTWIVSLNHQTFFVLTLKQQAGAFAGSLSWPEHWSTSTGASFSGVTPQILTRTFSTVSSAGQALHLTITDPANKDDSDEFDLSLIDDDHASLAWTGVPFPPWSMVRSRDPKVAVATNWDPKFVYQLEAPPELPNAQMATIFDEDQKARQAMPNSAGEWAPIEKADAQRRVQTRALLESGAGKHEMELLGSWSVGARRRVARSATGDLCRRD